jgi:hypothetical protein
MQDNCAEVELVVEDDKETGLDEALEVTIVSERLELRVVSELELEDELAAGHRTDDRRQDTMELPCVRIVIVFIAAQESTAGWTMPAAVSDAVHKGACESRARPS